MSNPSPLFLTKRLVVSRFTLADADDFLLLNGNPVSMQYIRPVMDRTASTVFLAENIRFYSEDSVLGRYMVRHAITDEFIGMFSFLYLSGEADFHLGYALLPRHWGKGYATELVETGKLYFFTHTTHPALFAITDPENTASEKVLARGGFRLQGTTLEKDKMLNKFVCYRDEAPAIA